VNDKGLRIAIISSPRCGNSWIRSTLAAALQIEEIAVHNYLDAPTELPEKCILQIHWYREPNFQAWLKAHNFKIITIARHPLDILVSALYFIRHEPQTARWLEGNAGLPGNLIGHAPCSQQFLDYALSYPAENLLSISYQWWHEPQALKLRYEDGVHDPARVLSELVKSLDMNLGSMDPWLGHASLDKMRSTPNRHGWQARPGLWRSLITPQDAVRIFWRHRVIFHKLGYSVGPYLLSRSAALRNWNELTTPVSGLPKLSDAVR